MAEPRAGRADVAVRQPGGRVLAVYIVHRAGLRARIVAGGTIRPSDPVVALTDPTPAP